MVLGEDKTVEVAREAEEMRRHVEDTRVASLA